MPRIGSFLTLLLASLLMASALRADDAPPPPKKPPRKTPEQRFDALEKAAKHDPLKGVLTKGEFVDAIKATSSPRMADRAEEMFLSIPKADPGKVTKDEFVKAINELIKSRGKKKDE
jgi:hypothetical protein